jgi:tetratricopeptide (TPR) repeat protein
VSRSKSRIASLLFAAAVGPALAAPYVPASDSEVLETIPAVARRNAGVLREIRNELARAPNNPEVAVSIAGRFYELGQTEGDPRYFGYAQAALQPWWSELTPPSEVLLLRAALRQSRHEFDAALRDLELLLKQQPNNARAWLLQAVILLTRADYSGATKSCEALTQLKEAFLAFSCLGSVAGLTGHAQGGYELLKYAEARAASASLPERVQLQTLLGKTAERLDEVILAEQHYTGALELRPKSPTALATYADFLLDQDRPKEVVSLLVEQTRIDGLLLRLSLAEQRLGLGTLANHVTELGTRYEASRARGDTLHQGDEARWRLHLLNDPGEALRLALANWSLQREPRDARIVLESAIAAHTPALARPVLEWLNQHALEDQRLRQLATQLGIGQ